MRTDLDHLPEAKQRELAHVVEVIREGFAEAISRRTMGRFRNGKILKIILFGSYARGDWVDDPVGRYFSDFDLLVVVSHEDLTDVPEFWAKTEDRLIAELSEGKELRAPVSPIYHSLDDVNEKLRLGRFFLHRHSPRRHRLVRGAGTSVRRAPTAECARSARREAAIIFERVVPKR